MSTLEQLVATLEAQGIRLYADGDNLRVDAPRGVLTPELRAELAAAKPALLDHLRRGSHRADPIPLAPRGDAMPLSFAQERLWFMDQLVPGSSFYNMAECLRLRGPVDPAALERTIREIVRRHETLRTAFRVEDGRAVQSVVEHLEMTVPAVDLRHVPEADRMAEAVRFAEEEAQRPFDIARPPLLRVHLVILADDDHVVVATMHHLVSDGWSLQLLRQEMVVLYEAFATGRPSPLPPLEIQYADFAAWQRERQDDEGVRAQLEYWRGQLAGASALELPVDHARPTLPTYEGRSLTFALPQEAAAGLKALAGRERSSLFAPLLAVFAVVMGRHAAREDLVIGSPVANRTRRELEPLIGFFVNTLALRVDLEGDPTFTELVRRVRAMAMDAFANQDLPFERIVAELQPERSANRNPLVQVMFALANAPASGARLRDLTVEPLHFERGRVRMDLEVHVWEGGDTVQGLLIFATDLFDDRTARRVVEHVRRVAERAAQAPDAPISTLSLLTDGERAELVAGWEGTRHAFADLRPVHERVAEQGRLRPAHPAVRCGDRTLTYGELNRRADALASRLGALGVSPGRIAAVFFERTPELVVAQLAVLRAGAAYLPLDPGHPRERNTAMLADADAFVLVTTSALAEVLASPGRPTVLADDDSSAVDSPDSSSAPSAPTVDRSMDEPGPDDPAFVIYTSGSTGAPKGVVLPHRALLNLVLWHLETFRLTPADCTSHLAAITFDASAVETWPTLAAGATLCQVPAEAVYDTARLPAWLAAQGVTTGFVPTGLAELLLQREWPADGPMRALLVGGDRLSRFPSPSLPFPIVNVYGPTECCVLTTTGRADPAAPGAGRPHIGRPLANVRVYVLGPGGEPEPPGVPGELFIAGAGVGTGYLGRPALTAVRFVPDPFGPPGTRMYRTGDRARLLDDGTFDFIDRLDRQVKIRGFRVEPGELEHALARHPLVRQAVVTVREDARGDRRLAAYVVPDLQAADSDPALRASGEAQVEQWRRLYQETYAGGAGAAPAFNTVGWNSSYTGEPLSADEMGEWVAHTVDRVLERAPRRVLEIGCGTGLLLHRIAPRTEEYWATDFSEEVLAQLRRQVDGEMIPGARVTLMHRLAHDLDGIAEGGVDAVILNSVVQYFPGVDYLVEVLERAVARVSPGGFVYLGDLRDRGLQKAFQASVELGNAPDELPLEALRARVRRRMDHEEELLVDPALFSALQSRIPRITRVAVQLRRGVHRNELTAYRFDVLLFVDEAPRESRPAPVLPWSDAWDGGVRHLEEALRHDAPEMLRVTGMPNARVAADCRVLRALEGAPGTESVGRLRAAAAVLQAPAVDPEEVWRTADGLGYAVEVRRSGVDPGRMDVLLVRRGATVHAEEEEAPAPRPLAEYASDPLWRVRVQALVPRLREHLRDRLPEWMLPTHLMVLRELPLTRNGKVDRTALPAPQAPAPAAVTAAPASPMEALISGVWCELLGREAIGLDENFFDCGGHSLMLVEAQSRLAARLGREIPVVALFQHPTVRSLAAHLGELASATAPAERPAAGSADGGRSGAIAIIGMSCRFPGAGSTAELWERLVRGERSIRELSVDEVAAAGVDRGLASRPDYVRAAAILEGIEDFDSGFFAMSPQEAKITDPQHRIFLECAYEALESAGYPPGRGSLPAGVFAGAAMNAYLFNNILPHRDSLDMADFMSLRIGNSSDFVASRVSYKLNLSGPAVNVQTTCSTSLVAVHYACRSLLSGECDMALAGGTAVTVPQAAGYLYRDGMILSPDGHCRAFDREARGTVPGGGAGVVLLKRLEDAIADGDLVHAVILGSAVNNDGAEKVGFTAPGLVGQARVVSGALAAAGVPAASIGYVEAHGTATRLGDPIEVAALTQAYRADGGGAPPRTRSCAIGSLKTNIGHADAAAGVAGLIKAVLVLQHGIIPQSLDFTAPNPELNLDDGPFYVAASAEPWARGEHPRRAGVSSFGIGGTNAHAVVEEAPARTAEPSRRPAHLLLVSGRSEAALAARAAALPGDLTGGHEVADVAFTLQTSRTHFAHRGMRVHAGEGAPGRLITGVAGDTPPPVAFLFSGQGSQFPGMGRGLYEAEPVFRAELDRCRDLLRPHLEVDLFDVLFPAGADRAAGAERLRRTALAQPTLVAVEYALARLWMSLGIAPPMLIGHSVGEYTAACIAGVLSLEDVLRVVAARGRMVQALPAGAMLAISLPPERLAPMLGDGLSLAAVNHPEQCVASGPTAEIDRLRRELEGEGITCKGLHTSHAFHSAMMDPVLGDFRRLMAGVVLRPPAIPILSNLTGTWLTDEEATDPDYWTSHLRQTVRFADGVSRILEHPGAALVEVGPGRALAAVALRHAARTLDHPCVASLPRLDEGWTEAAEHGAWLEALGQLWLAGAEVDWPRLYAGERRLRVPLATYPFQRERAWMDAPALPSIGTAVLRPTASRPAGPARLYGPRWRPDSPSSTPVANGDGTHGTGGHRWLLFVRDDARGAALAEGLARHGEVTTVRPGDGFRLCGERTFTLRPDSAEDHRQLFDALQGEGASAPDRIVYLWTDGRAPDGAISADGTADGLPHAVPAGFLGLLHLAGAAAARSSSARITVVTESAALVEPSDRVDPWGALFLGPCRVIPQEYPSLSCAAIDVDASVPEESTNALLRELLADDPSSASTAVAPVALRGGRRFLLDYDEVDDADLPPPALPRPGGVYLITGGLGGIGRAIAEHLASSARARVVLVSRSADPDSEAAREACRAIEALGGEALVVRADVADADAMRKAVAAARRRFGHIDVAVHAAGVAGGGLIGHRSPADIARVFAPKVTGTLNLARALEADPPELLVLCSSLASTVGGVGQADYSGANAFQDAFAQAHPLRTVSIAWDAWREVGMAVNTPVPPEMRAERAALLQAGLGTVHGVQAFDRALRSGERQVLVAAAALPERLATLRGETADGRPAAPGAVAADDIERTLTGIWRELLGHDRIGADDSFFALGGDSLLAIRAVGRAREVFQVDLPLGQLLAAPTVAGAAEAIRRRLGDAAPPAESTPPSSVTVPAAPSPSTNGSSGAAHPSANVSTRPRADVAWGSVVPLGTGRNGRGQAFFCIHPLAGIAFPYDELARRMGSGHAVYGIESAGLSAATPLRRMEDVAAECVRGIRAIQPEGPYALGGWSFGALAAFQVAAQLRAEGDEVSLLALIDQPAPRLLAEQFGRRDRLAMVAAMSRGIWPYLGGFFPRLRDGSGAPRGMRARWRLLREQGAIAGRVLGVMRGNLEAVWRWSPSPAPVRVTLLRTDRFLSREIADPRWGWDALAEDGVVVHELSGHHMAVLQSPHVDELAGRLRACLEPSASSSSHDGGTPWQAAAS